MWVEWLTGTYNVTTIELYNFAYAIVSTILRHSDRRMQVWRRGHGRIDRRAELSVHAELQGPGQQLSHGLRRQQRRTLDSG